METEGEESLYYYLIPDDDTDHQIITTISASTLQPLEQDCREDKVDSKGRQLARRNILEQWTGVRGPLLTWSSFLQTLKLSGASRVANEW